MKISGRTAFLVAGLLTRLALVNALDTEGKSSVKTRAVDSSEYATITVDTDIPKTEVYLDGLYRGITPLTLDGIAPGIRVIDLEKRGYYREHFRIEAARGQETQIYVELARIVGTLVVTGAPEGARVIVGDAESGQTRLTLPEGDHQVTVRAFGYVEKTATVAIHRRLETELDGALDKAPFAASGFRPSKRAFNPESPSALGAVELSFSVTAPGVGAIAIANDSGVAVADIDCGRFSTWRQTVSWDGADASGKRLPDGTYGLTLRVRGDDGTEQTLTGTVKLDRTIVYPLTEAHSGVGGYGPNVVAQAMPSGGLAMTIGLGRLDDSTETALALLGGIGYGAEAGAALALHLADGGAVETAVGAGVKKSFGTGPWRGAAFLRYACLFNATLVEASVLDGIRGLAIGTAGEAKLGVVTLGADVGVAMGDEHGILSSPECRAQAGLTARAEGKTLTAALWAHLATSPFGDSFDPTRALAAGISTRFIVPSTNVLLALNAAYGLAGLTESEWRIGVSFGAMF
jgi:hypothetical protein